MATAAAASSGTACLLASPASSGTTAAAVTRLRLQALDSRGNLSSADVRPLHFSRRLTKFGDVFLEVGGGCDRADSRALVSADVSACGALRRFCGEVFLSGNRSNFGVGGLRLRWRSAELFGLVGVSRVTTRSTRRICAGAKAELYSPTYRESRAVAASSSVVVRGNPGVNSSGNLRKCPSNFGLSSRSLCGFGAPQGTGTGLRRKKFGRAMVGNFGEPARDKVMGFGKFKGSLLGTMSSKYLRWMANNLRGTMLSEWAQYAEEVLVDDYYRDRLEWEKVEKMMITAHDIRSVKGKTDVLGPAIMYGWDLDNDAGWRKVNLSLLGTSRGGRIPRVKSVVSENAVPPAEIGEKSTGHRPESEETNMSSYTKPPAVDDSSSSSSLRDELMRRRSQRRERVLAKKGPSSGQKAELQVLLLNRFPGRDSLVNSVREGQDTS